MLIRAVVMVTFLIICTIVSYTDIRKQKIYNEAVAALFVPAIVSFFAFPEISADSRLLGAVSVSGMMLLICLIVPGAFGGGDVKLMVPVGLFLGLERVLLAGVLAVFAAGVWSVAVVLYEVHRSRKKMSEGVDRYEGDKCDKPKTNGMSLWKTKLRAANIRKKRIPFGPALCIGAALTLLL